MKKKWIIILVIALGIGIGTTMFFFLRNKTFSVTIDSDNGISNYTINVSKNDTIKKPKDPQKEGYTFEGWYIGDEKFDFNNKITENTTLTAKWAKILSEDEVLVVFDTDGGNKVVEISVKKGEVISKPTNPTKNGYKFVEWQLEGKAFTFDTKIEKNITLVAKWEEDETVKVTRYTVTFDSNGGSTVASKTVVENATVAKPGNPTKTNYNFIEWQLSGRTYDFSTKVTKNITLKAVWREKDKVTITFDSDGGTSVSSRQVYQGNSLGSLPTNPTKSGYTFDGWYNSSTKYEASSVINNNITIKAKWIDNNDIALNNAKAAISNSYNITSGGQAITASYTGCTIIHTNPDVIARITRATSNTNVTLNFSITCGSKSGTKSATGVILASPYTYTAEDSGNHMNYNVHIKQGNNQISNSGEVWDLNVVNFLSDFTSGLAVLNNLDINGFPNFKIVLSSDANTLFVIAKQ